MFDHHVVTLTPSAMAGVQGFVHGAQASQPLPPRHDRVRIAKDAKISTKKPNFHLTDLSQRPASAVPGPGYAPDPILSNNIFAQQQYGLQTKGHIRGILDDDTVSSQFDDTKSEVGGFQGNQQMQDHPTAHLLAADEYSDPDDVDGHDRDFDNDVKYDDYPRHEAARSQGMNNNTPFLRNHHGGGSSISGRFMSIQGVPNALPSGDIHNRPGQIENVIRQPRGLSKKRPQPHENVRGEIGSQQQNPAQIDEHEFQGAHANGFIQLEKDDRSEGINVDESQSENAIDPHHLQGTQIPAEGRLPFDGSRLGPDYSDEELRKMDYQQLKAHDWDNDLLRGSSNSNTETGDNTGSLEDKLADFQKGTSQDVLFGYFANLKMAEWEETGDVLLRKFEELMKKMRVARQNRRAMVSDFEKRIEEREVLVRCKFKNLEQKFVDMRKGGEVVLRGKLS